MEKTVVKDFKYTHVSSVTQRIKDNSSASAHSDQLKKVDGRFIPDAELRAELGQIDLVKFQTFVLGIIQNFPEVNVAAVQAIKSQLPGGQAEAMQAAVITNTLLSDDKMINTWLILCAFSAVWGIGTYGICRAWSTIKGSKNVDDNVWAAVAVTLSKNNKEALADAKRQHDLDPDVENHFLELNAADPAAHDKIMKMILSNLKGTGIPDNAIPVEIGNSHQMKLVFATQVFGMIHKALAASKSTGSD